ncbi:biofilm PGA synthesis N-glycosyltransferase PgaC [Pedobacter africanus]|uniref:Cellulose synthase/poly-beta-1,6-N-acetylglucosamine synthase-like glycosyltransferase n=1 Tax=Pedobacter africanus TaxID=151894 RepID=A0ACC6KT76_9SPHI|nr:glycosyltransferase family 2 protein [Pedobacter africanus]MDR6782464.1 cellulose synthase/poly-beta-1,6-N-acetylglucosamine synthase-like glycosyltransferase [Pedobacter africanus]
MIIAFWISLFLIVYTFIGYGIVLYVLVKIKRFFVKASDFSAVHKLPNVTLLIAAYNEEDIIVEKINNTLQLNYPAEKIQFIFITDGSSDGTAERVRTFKEVVLLHEDRREGKMAAIKRAIPFIEGEVTVFTDANTFLNRDAILELVKHYQNPKVGAVAGEKRILVDETADASSAGEGFYWKYESLLKKWDYELYSNVGAAGELFSIRTSLYQPVESDTIIDDHMIAMRIAEKGYIIAYEPGAYAMETASANTAEELKRKIRIAAGGIQSIFRLKKAANPFYYPVLTFQYFSHRVLRWTITPFLLVLTFALNVLIVATTDIVFYKFSLAMQVLFYLLSLAGMFFESRSIRIKALFVPYYFCMMNYAVVAGIFRYFRKAQSAAWEKSKRK